MKTNERTREFVDEEAKPGKMALLIGITSMSGGGKTFSALELATGIQEVVGGDIFGIDTESGRMKHHADRYKFRHIPFGAPFSPLDYLAAFEHCQAKKAGVVILDSTSHEHEGTGGVLDWHDHEIDNCGGNSFAAWREPKAARRKLINHLVQSQIPTILCFRAKTGSKQQKNPVTGKKEIVPCGTIPIAGDDFVYEQTVGFLLRPGSEGWPEWNGQTQEEKDIIKLPGFFHYLFTENQQLSRIVGREMGLWSVGKPTGRKAEELAAIDRVIKTGHEMAPQGWEILFEWWNKQSNPTKKALVPHMPTLKEIAAKADASRNQPEVVLATNTAPLAIPDTSPAKPDPQPAPSAEPPLTDGEITAASNLWMHKGKNWQDCRTYLSGIDINTSKIKLVMDLTRAQLAQLTEWLKSLPTPSPAKDKKQTVTS